MLMSAMVPVNGLARALVMPMATGLGSGHRAGLVFAIWANWPSR